MRVRFSRRAEKFIRNKGAQQVFVSLVELDVADSLGATKDISVGFDAPAEMERFSRHQVEGIYVHIDKALKITGPVVIKMQGFWKLSSLYADGLQVPL